MSRWNHNLHFHPVLLDAMPAGARRALDIGCGEGVLTRELRRRVDDVTGIDLDEPSIELARSHRDDITYVVGDALDHPFEPASFDVVVSVATIHHMDMATALERMRSLLRPGGMLGVIGLARSRLPADLPYDVASSVATQVLQRTGGRELWETPAPKVWPPPVGYADARAIAERVLPGVRYRRHLLWRYTLLWFSPSA